MNVTIGLPTVPVMVQVQSVKVPTVAASIKALAGKLYFTLTLQNLKVSYKTSASIFSTTGVAVYPKMVVTGAITPAPGKSVLDGVSITADDPQITDSVLPSVAIEALAILFKNKLNTAISDAVAATARSLVDKLLLELSPTVGIAFPLPITQASMLESVSVGGGSGAALNLSFKTLIQAATPVAAAKGNGVIKRAVKGAEPTIKASVTARFGAPLVNQYLFAVWDAGNLAGIRFTRAELEQLGMEKLSFPYTQLDHVEIKVLLPPLLQWRAGVPYLDVGGIEMLVVVDMADDPRAWTAANVPVALVNVGQDLRLKPNASRPVQQRQVGFDKLNTAADHDAVQRILRTAVPGVVKKVFSTLPQIVLPKIQLTRLDGSNGPRLSPKLTSITTAADHWMLGLEIKRAP